MKLAAGLVTYGDYVGLERTLKGLWGCDEIFVIHCKFENNPVEIPDSLEKTIDVCKASKFPIKLSNMKGTEFQARSLYLDLCAQYYCNYLLIIDSDEYIFDPSPNNWGAFRYNLQHVAEYTYGGKHNVFGIWETLGWMNDCGWSYYPRIWYKPSEMMYKSGSHFRFINKKDFSHYYDDYSQVAETIIEGIRLVHTQDLRLPKMNEGRDQYHKWLREEETRISLTWLNRPIGHGHPSS
jgi:hypothetical protein